MGIVSADMLVARRWPDALWRCDGVELRADGVPAGDLAGHLEAFDAEKRRRGFAGPVVFTLRLQRDGGAWKDADAPARAALWSSLPPGSCGWVDLEVEEIARIAPGTVEALRSSGVKILLSHHAFVPEDPAVWERHLEAMRAFGPDGVKFAVTSSRERLPELMELARRVGAEFPASCVLGMGADASVTRVLSPLRGCPFTYGFLGEGAVAPGQLPVATMRAFFERAAASGPERPEDDAAASDWIAWADSLLKKVKGV